MQGQKGWKRLGFFIWMEGRFVGMAVKILGVEEHLETRPMLKSGLPEPVENLSRAPRIGEVL